MKGGEKRMAVEGETSNFLKCICDNFKELVKRRPQEGGEMARRISEANRKLRELQEEQEKELQEKVTEGS